MNEKDKLNDGVKLVCESQCGSITSMPDALLCMHGNSLTIFARSERNISDENFFAHL